MPWPLPSEGGRKRAKLIRTMATINRLQNSKLLKTDALLGVAHMGKIDVNFFKAVALYNPAATTHTHVASNIGSGFTDAGVYSSAVKGGKRSAAEDVDAVQFLMSSGSIVSGEFRLYGIKGS